MGVFCSVARRNKSSASGGKDQSVIRNFPAAAERNNFSLSVNGNSFLIKQKFYKGSSKARGSGIGLAVCEEIIVRHMGELIIENAPDGGVLVTVKLPVAKE